MAGGRSANSEQFITFFLIGVLTLVILSVLAYSTLGVGRVEEQDLAFLLLEGQVLQETVAPWFGIAFWIAAIIALFTTNLGILDYTSRLIADQFKIHALKDNQIWTESRIYAATVWFMIIVGSLILLAGVDQPFVLVVIASSIAGVQMFIYSGLLIMLNRKALPKELQDRRDTARGARRLLPVLRLPLGDARPRRARVPGIATVLRRLWLRVLVAMTMWIVFIGVMWMTGIITIA